VDESVDNGLMDIAPDLSNAVLKLRSSVWPWLHVVKFSLYMVPKVFDGIHVRAECRPWQHPDVVLLKKVGGFSCRMRSCIIVLKHEVVVLMYVGQDHGPENLVDVPLCGDSISTTWADVAEYNWSNELIQPNCTPDHDTRITPCVHLQDIGVCIAFSSSPPNTNSSVGITDTESTLIGEKNCSPMSPSPVLTILGPKQSLLSVPRSKNRTNSRSTAVKASVSKSASYCVAGNGSSGCFCSCFCSCSGDVGEQ